MLLFFGMFAGNSSLNISFPLDLYTHSYAGSTEIASRYASDND